MKKILSVIVILMSWGLIACSDADTRTAANIRANGNSSNRGISNQSSTVSNTSTVNTGNNSPARDNLSSGINVSENHNSGGATSGNSR